ncbi:hypothetical protein [Hymenobacter terrenus]|uniref:hypothetical protein n=1 Tax=Hymenobacter terrenus TaxID=1629124 RepID=UPI000619F6B9|nr:hypothetical protein [Hymenobacter terrenus]
MATKTSGSSPDKRRKYDEAFFKFLSLGLLGLVLTQCVPGDPPVEPGGGTNPGTSTCYLTSATEQLERNGAFTDFIDRRFGYSNGLLVSESEQSIVQGFGPVKRKTNYQLQYQNGLLTQAVDSLNLIVFEYAPGASSPSQAVYSRLGRQRAVYTLTYAAPGRLSGIKETNQVLPLNSLATERDFTFTYDGNGNVINERLRLKFSTGNTGELQTDYTFTNQPSPYQNVPNRVALTVLALAGEVETFPGEFWHRNTPSGFAVYNVNAAGVRTPNETATLTGQYDATNKLTVLDQNSSTLRRIRTTFGYQCQ